MLLAELVSALKLSKNEFLLPVRVIKLAAFILTKGIADKMVENRLHGITLHNLGQPLVVVVDEAPFESLFES